MPVFLSFFFLSAAAFFRTAAAVCSAVAKYSWLDMIKLRTRNFSSASMVTSPNVVGNAVTHTIAAWQHCRKKRIFPCSYVLMSPLAMLWLNPNLRWSLEVNDLANVHRHLNVSTASEAVTTAGAGGVRSRWSARAACDTPTSGSHSCDAP